MVYSIVNQTGIIRTRFKLAHLHPLLVKNTRNADDRQRRESEKPRKDCLLGGSDYSGLVNKHERKARMEHVLIGAEAFLDDDSVINVHRFLLKDNETMSMHAHNFIEIAYISSGQGTHIIGGICDKVSKGDLVLLNDNVPHQFVVDEGSTLCVYNCIFFPKAIDSTLGKNKNFVHLAYNYLFHSFRDEKAPNDYIKLKIVDTNDIENLLREMERESETKKEGFRQILRSDLMRLLIFIFRLYRDDSMQNHSTSTYKKLIVKNAVSYIRNNFAGDLKCADIAARSYISKSYFARIFKEVTGKTFIRFLQEARIAKACELLESTNYSVGVIAEKTGYSDMKYFYKLFNDLKGLPPGKYRSTVT